MKTEEQPPLRTPPATCQTRPGLPDEPIYETVDDAVQTVAAWRVHYKSSRVVAGHGAGNKPNKPLLPIRPSPPAAPAEPLATTGQPARAPGTYTTRCARVSFPYTTMGLQPVRRRGLGAQGLSGFD